MQGSFPAPKRTRANSLRSFTAPWPAPLLADCPINIACRLVQTVAFPTNELFVGEIVEAFCGKDFLSGGIPDLEKLKPFTLTMPDNRYWSMGQPLGRAWSIGKDFKK